MGQPMKILRGVRAVPGQWRGCAITMGNFDGVHRGHQLVMGQLLEYAAARAACPVVIVFEPQPQEYFTPHKAPSRLTTLREKAGALQPCGINNLVCLRFDRALAEMEPEEFVLHHLVRGLGARLVIVGDDFRFGRARRGDFDLLQEMGRAHGYDLAATTTFALHERRVSSSWIRELLAGGDLETASRLLGRPFTIVGRVVRGEQVGRILGYPTANIDLRGRVPPIHGIYAVQVRGLGADLVNGVASLGTRPVFGGTRLLLEIHLFDWNRDIYGRRISVQFLRHLRAERNFSSVDQLRAQIALDVQQARSVLAAG